MKKAALLLTAVLGLVASSPATTITLWNFNSSTSDTNPATGTFTPAIGFGTLTNIGGTAGSFATPANGGQTATSDPETNDNSGLRLGTFPTSTANNKTAGIQFFVSTVGYEGIQVVFDQENSATASLYWRAQYTTNGTDWVDYTVLQAAGGTAWLKARVVDLSTVPGIKNNPNFGFRYVSEWVSTATGSGVSSYQGNSGTYGTAGTLWVDMVTVNGSPLNTGNNDPTISAISNQTIHANQATSPIGFIVGDVETAASNLVLSAEFSNPGLISGFLFSGSGTNRFITITPVANLSGSTMVTVGVTDEGLKKITSSFSLTVLPPSIAISNQTMRVNSSRTIALDIAEYSSFLGAVTVSASSVDGTLLPPGSLVVGGSGSNRNLTITPAANELGYAIITVSATDGSLTANGSVFLNVVASNTVALWNFNSPLRDFITSTGTTNAIYGSGFATPLVADGTFGANGTSSDLDGEDNSRWRLGTFPSQNTGNKTGGAEFRLSTVGFQDIEFTWEHYNSASGSRYWRVQYSIDGVNFTDALSYSNLVVTTFFPMTNSFMGVAGVANNPNFAVRIVSEFESTAVPGSTNGYVGVQASGGYTTAGTLWLDTIKFTGNSYVAVTPATLTVSHSGNDVLISWPASAVGTLYGSSSLGASANWQPVSETPVVQALENVVTIVNPAGNKFYRLVQ